MINNTSPVFPPIWLLEMKEVCFLERGLFVEIRCTVFLVYSPSRNLERKGDKEIMTDRDQGKISNCDRRVGRHRARRRLSGWHAMALQSS